MDVNRPAPQAKTVLMMAAGEGCARGGTALMYALMGGDPQLVETMLDRSAKVNAAGANGWTALMIASAKGRDAIIGLLLKRGADINARDMYGSPPLMRAA